MIWTRKHIDPKWGESGVQAYDGRKFVGELLWYSEGFEGIPVGEISSVFVYSQYRRRGVATELLRLARLIEPGIIHSPVRSWLGDAWARSTGDALPPLGLKLDGGMQYVPPDVYARMDE